jgi:hypothetical protein
MTHTPQGTVVDNPLGVSKAVNEKVSYSGDAISMYTHAQFIAVCRRSKWSKNWTNSPLLALLATAGSNATCKISSACSNAC